MTLMTATYIFLIFLGAAIMVAGMEIALLRPNRKRARRLFEEEYGRYLKNKLEREAFYEWDKKFIEKGGRAKLDRALWSNKVHPFGGLKELREPIDYENIDD